MPLSETERKIIDLLAELYGWPDGAYWLMSHNELLGGKRADAMILEGKEDEVLNCLQRLADGVYI